MLSFVKYIYKKKNMFNKCCQRISTDTSEGYKELRNLIIVLLTWLSENK